jgi:SpoVK/Ycf46/Vps4 family AAA+-type ATPase
MRLDLSSVLSKWLGETEKFLGQIFDIAEMTGSVLVLDEAEALFRQRESSGDGPDGMRTVVSYLLVRLERFEGCLVATTNRTRDLDEAFFRRFDDFIVVPVPDEATRLLLWRSMLGRGLEDGANMDGLDLAFIARQFAISGGLVRGAAMRALAWAEGEGRPLDTPICMAALARELEKNDRSSAEVFVEPYKETVLALLKGETASA